MHRTVTAFLTKASSRKAIRRMYGYNWGCYYFLFEKQTVNCSVQCHVFAQSPPSRHPNDKYPVNTSQRFRFVSKCFTAVLFGSNGNSYTDSKQLDMCVFNHKVRHPRCVQYTNRVDCMFGKEAEGV